MASTVEQQVALAAAELNGSGSGSEQLVLKGSG